ncbi:MAG: putative glyoxalase/bleomycin resistance protein/dioxygenase [Anaerocolumna sp.]|jgi:predicted enzyme related to lactoylglutathione lyase|nr:putative glyoxalase/bleomycin resistance protein/dioxygenase [Anaerocolumna sp.]
MQIKYAHTNIIAKDWKSLSAFYQRVFGCKPVPPARDIKGEWIDKLTNMKDVHITGEHLSLPGYEEFLPTLEIFSYNTNDDNNPKGINTVGLAHLAFEVEDVEVLLDILIKEGGGQVGEVVKTEYPGGMHATFVYATDIEGNIIELQSWKSTK